MTIVPGGDDRLCERGRRGKADGGVCEGVERARGVVSIHP